MIIKEIIYQRDFIDFHNQLIKIASDSIKVRFYVGVNFKNDSILSYKFYYTFFDINCIHPFPIKSLENHFLSFKDKLSLHHITNPAEFGSGITFTLKYELEDNTVSRGVYFRIMESAEPYITKFLEKMQLESSEYQNHFDKDSILKYIAINPSGEIKERNYIYCRNGSFLNEFDTLSGIYFSNAETIEISTDWEGDLLGNNIRFIGLSTQSLTNDVTNREIQNILEQIGSRTLQNPELFQIHGYYLFKDIKSVFFFKTTNRKDLLSLIVDEYKKE